MKVLSIDLSRNHFGYSIIEDSKLIHYGSENIIKLQKLGELARESFIYNYFKDILNTYKPNIILSENFFYMSNPKTFAQLQLLQGLLTALAFEFNINIEFFSITRYRKYLKVTSKKSAEIKLEVAKKVLEVYPDVILDKEYDISDCIGMSMAYFQNDNSIS